jgi:hypothetical protein
VVTVESIILNFFAWKFTIVLQVGGESSDKKITRNRVAFSSQPT